MEWLKELLKKSGFDESKVDELVADVNKELPKHFVAKTQYNDVVEARKKAEKEVADRDKQLGDLKKSVGDNDELKQQIAKLQADNKAAAEKYASDLKELKTNTALRLAIGDSAHDAELVLSLLDKTKIELDEDGGIKAGFEEQLQSLRETKAFLFAQKQEKEDEKKGPTFKGITPADGAGGSGGHHEVDYENMSDAEYYKLMEQQKNK
ncbi:phage scaffolding protein [Paenibacillus alvei]|uniref:phage scaffolding protein n=1 Tax=Paenibacillus alvei TaxID=44250 RepID=UPI0002880995|nr:phage scaffolding protein [Paenibacillus alvei]EJW14730.1 phage minor structural protein GP20 [Paenibacillus alvei DSM 29]MCY9540927.1 phage scaffolding protein [Paenibacillus alvei]MCY9708169.1 phage scaffolding protein [Paenibacillus alvei]MEC0080198.1 phage scaffolding protein [Paenibacillus alvei]NEZ43317.1 hypothetical protein [Paenibacillus alvei]